MNKIEKFNKFLEENNCKDEFYAIVCEHELGHMTPEKFLVCAFTWDHSYQGHEYWLDIDNKWQEYLKQGD